MVPLLINVNDLALKQYWMFCLAESFEACRISEMRHDTREIRISDKKIGMIDQS